MIKIDLVTGFLGSGKTTFIRNYANYLIKQGTHVGIIENDFGAVNVDMLLLQDLEGEKCDLEPIVGGNDATDWKRRFKAKLILFALQGVERVLVEPSGIFDVNTFKEILYDESLSSKYEIGNIFSIVDAKLEDCSSKEMEYLLVSQIASCGRILLSKVESSSKDQLAHTSQTLSDLLCKYDCDRTIQDRIYIKSWNEMEGNDYQILMNSGWVDASFKNLPIHQNDVFQSLFFTDVNMTQSEIAASVKQLWKDTTLGNIMRVKGFFLTEGTWYEVNATKEHLEIQPVKVGQAVVIVIGVNLKKDTIEAYFRK